MRRLAEPSVLISIGGLAYMTIELLYRGYSHWTMFYVGGLAFWMIGCINEYIEWSMPLWKQMAIGSLIITSLELVSGIIINMILGWDVWDYSQLPFNVLGQICLPFSIIWFFLSLVAIVVDDYIRYWIFKEEKPTYTLF